MLLVYSRDDALPLPQFLPLTAHPRATTLAIVTDWVDQVTFSERVDRRDERPKPPDSPYRGVVAVEQRQDVTRELLRGQPLDGPTLLEAVLASWKDIFESRLGPALIGVDLKPAPQIMGFFLHELIPLRLSISLTGWRRDSVAGEKDLVYVSDPSKSIEIKTSSDAQNVFGNRSFGLDGTSSPKKARSGYYCAVNFDKWSVASGRPQVRRVRYGWLDSTDWVAQRSQTGQSSTLPAVVYNTQLPLLFER